MNLKSLRTRIRSLCREPRENYILDEELNDWLNDASFEATKDLSYPWTEMVLHGIEEQADYTFSADFIRFQNLLDVFFGKQKLIKRTVQWLEKEYPDYQSASGIDYPEYYYTRFYNKISIYPPPKLIASGTATAGSGTTTLIDSSASFVSSYVGHSIRRVSDGLYGLITAVNSSTQLTATLSGAGNWTSGNAYKINRSGTVPYVYKETAMSEDTHESEVSKNYPYLIIYRVMPLAEVKAYRTDVGTQQQVRTTRWDTHYTNELARAISMVNRSLRGRSATIGPYSDE